MNHPTSFYLTELESTLLLSYFLFLQSFITTLYLANLWSSLSENKKLKIHYFIKKMLASIFGDKIEVTESARPIREEYSKARGFYFGGRSDSIWIRKHKNKVKQCNVFLHEIGHWVGHPTRNNRILVGVDAYKSQKATTAQKYHYAREELIAELISLRLRKYFNLPSYCIRDRKYLRDWLGVFKDFFPYKSFPMRVGVSSPRVGEELSLNVAVKKFVPMKEYREILREANEGFDYIVSRRKNVKRINSYIVDKLANSGV